PKLVAFRPALLGRHGVPFGPLRANQLFSCDALLHVGHRSDRGPPSPSYQTLTDQQSRSRLDSGVRAAKLIVFPAGYNLMCHISKRSGGGGVCVHIALVLGLLAATVQGADVDSLLQTIMSVGPEGDGQAAAQEALQSLS